MLSKFSKNIASFVAIAALSMGSSKAQDAQLLMYAAKLNVGYRIADECDKTNPGFLYQYERHLGIVVDLVEPRGINEELRRKADTIPELSSIQYLEKFKALPVEGQLRRCIKVMLEIQEEAADAQALSNPG